MTETTIRWGLKPLIALLLTVMALLLADATRPVQAAVASGTISVQTAGWVNGPDTVSWLAQVDYSGADFSVHMDYQYEVIVEYCHVNGTVTPDPQILSGSSPIHVNGGSPISSYSTFVSNTGPPALEYMNAHSDIVGFRWCYHLKVDAMVNATGVSANTADRYSEYQTYGSWVAPPAGGGGGTDV